MVRKKISLKNSKEAPEVARSLLFVGLFTRVAEELGLSVSHVNKVARSKAQSKRVTEAIIREVRRIERQTERAA